MIKEAREFHHNYYMSLGMEKTANLEKYLPWALGAGLLGSGAYGVHKLMNPPSMWDKTKDFLGSMGPSMRDLGKDLYSMAAQNPQLLGTMMGQGRMYSMPQMQSQIPMPQMQGQVPQDQMPMGGFAEPKKPFPPAPTMPPENNIPPMEETGTMSFSPYQI
jgi:hypothetical protein